MDVFEPTEQIAHMMTIDHYLTVALRAADALPLVSVALQRALALLAKRDDVSIGELAISIEQDVVIAGTVLSMANSAFYGRSVKVASVRQAVARLGANKTRNVLLGLSVTRAFKSVLAPTPWSSSRFNSHSLATAILSDLIARKIPALDAEWTFIAGLMHDIGLLLIASALPQEFKTIVANAESDVQLVEQEQALLGFSHFELSAELIARWNFPATVQDAARFCQCMAFEFSPPLQLGAIVKTASLLADSHKFSIFDFSEENSITSELLEALALDEPIKFIAEFESDYRALQLCAA
jgi:HD-like signal output (HDOD) protein